MTSVFPSITGPAGNPDWNAGLSCGTQRHTILPVSRSSAVRLGTCRGLRRRRTAGRDRQTRVMGLLEFSRALHAEMDALLSAGRNGVSVRGAELFATTFPCHECAKLILGAGISRVLYIEPYPKSRVAHMYEHEIATTHHRRVCVNCGDTRVPSDNDERGPCASCGKTTTLFFDELGQCTTCGEEHLARFEPFTGVGPGRFLELFSLIIQGTRQKRKDDHGYKQGWQPAQRKPLVPASYLQKETLLKDKFEPVFAKFKRPEGE